MYIRACVCLFSGLPTVPSQSRSIKNTLESAVINRTHSSYMCVKQSLQDQTDWMQTDLVQIPLLVINRIRSCLWGLFSCQTHESLKKKIKIVITIINFYIILTLINALFSFIKGRDRRRGGRWRGRWRGDRWRGRWQEEIQHMDLFDENHR